MDKQRFDNLTKAFATGQSRRSVLKGLLGFGGAAAVSTIVAAETDARRSRGSRPPRQPVCEAPLVQCGTSTFCCEAGQCAHNDVGCCPAGTSACDTNSTGCCSDCDNGGVTCGYDCCDSADACCDNECCPIGEVCVARKLDCSNNFCEERCCDDNQICDGRCCHGVCFSPLDSGLTGYDRACCPPLPGFSFCPGTGVYSGQGLCCSGDTPNCCNDNDGRPVCLTEEQCCTHSECAYLDDATQCLRGRCTRAFECVQRTVCGDGETCCEGGDNVCCPGAQDCCGPLCCADGLSCCAVTGACIDPATQCCDAIDCSNKGFALGCVVCDDANTCAAANFDQECASAACFRCSSTGQCEARDSLCDDSNICTTDICTANGCANTPIPNCCQSQTDCKQGETCYQNTCTICQTEEQVCSGKCGTFTNNCGEQFTCTCTGDESCQGTSCVVCQTFSETCSGRCGFVPNNCGTQFDCGSTCAEGRCVGTNCVCDGQVTCTTSDDCCSGFPYCNGQNGGTCGSCMEEFTDMSCTIGGTQCCSGRRCVQATSFNFCASCIASGQSCSPGNICCTGECPSSGGACP